MVKQKRSVLLPPLDTGMMWSYSRSSLEPHATQRYMHLTPATLEATVRLLDQPRNVLAVGGIMEMGRV